MTTKLLLLAGVLAMAAGCTFIGTVDTLRSQNVFLTSKSALQDTSGDNDEIRAIEGLTGADVSAVATVPVQ